MAAITLEFLQQCRANIEHQGRERISLVQQSIGAMSVLDQLIEAAKQDDVAVMPAPPANSLGADVSNQSFFTPTIVSDEQAA